MAKLRPMDNYQNKQIAENQDLNRRNVLRTTTMLLSAVLVGFVPGVAGAQTIEKKGTTPYVTHFIFRPLMNIDIPGLGTATNLEAVGTTQNMKGEKMLDKMSARCAALSVASGDKKYIDGACVLTDSDGDQIFSTFDTRDVDKSQPQMNCGTHIITGGSGKYKGITGSEPFASSRCQHWLAPAAIPRWISRTTRVGRSNKLHNFKPPQCETLRWPDFDACVSESRCMSAVGTKRISHANASW
jgi:hypothetical protein